MSARRPRWRNLGAIAAAFGVTLAAPMQTLAINCIPPRAANSSFYSASLTRDGTTAETKVRGVRGTLDTDEIPYADRPGTSESYVSVRGSGGGHHATMGFVAVDINELWYFYEYDDVGVGPRRFLFQPEPWDRESFEVVWTNTPGNGEYEFLFWFGPSQSNQTLASSPVLHWSPDDGQIGGATFSRKSQFPGRVSNKVRFTGTQALVDGSYVGFGNVFLYLGVTAPWANFEQIPGENGKFRSWDRDCP